MFKVGDRVKYVGKYSRFITYNATGFIVAVDYDGGWDVVFSDGHRWFCMESNLIKTPSKNQQLEFAFML